MCQEHLVTFRTEPMPQATPLGEVLKLWPVSVPHYHLGTSGSATAAPAHGAFRWVATYRSFHVPQHQRPLLVPSFLPSHWDWQSAVATGAVSTLPAGNHGWPVLNRGPGRLGQPRLGPLWSAHTPVQGLVFSKRDPVHPLWLSNLALTLE